MSIMQTLKRCELFIGLSDNDIQKIIDLHSCGELEYQAEEIIFEAGKEADYLYVLEEGQVNLILKLPPSPAQPLGETVFRSITRGGIFGWTSLVPPHFHFSTAISKSLSKVVRIGGGELRALFEKDQRLGYEIMNSLLNIIASRVWNLEQLLVTGQRSPFI